MVFELRYNSLESLPLVKPADNTLQDSDLDRVGNPVIDGLGHFAPQF